MPAKPQHPYLYFNSSDLEAIQRRVGRDTRERAVYLRIIKESDRLLEEPVPATVPRRFSGIRPYFDAIPYGDYVSALAGNAYLLAFSYQMPSEEKYGKKAYEFAAALSSLDSWVATWDKFPYLYWSGKPYGAKWNEEEENEIVYSFDLDTASACRKLAAVYDWLYPLLTDSQRARLRSALLENGILRVRGNYDYHWWAHSWRTNWLPIAFNGLGTAALALYGEDPQLVDVVEESYGRINRFLEEAIGTDGGYQEGVGNWVSSMNSIVQFGAALNTISRGQVDLFQHPSLRRTIHFPLFTFAPPRGSVPFGDSFPSLRGNWQLYNKLATELESPSASWLAGFFHDFDATSSPAEPLSIIWPETSVEPSLPDSSEPLSRHFRTIDWVILRSSWENPDHPLLAAKGGSLDDPQHGHLDAGQFAIHFRGEWYVRELGYMNPSGFSYWDYRRRFKENIHASSRGHNVVFVNAEEQQLGRQFAGKVIGFETSAAKDYVLIDVSAAYPNQHLKEWRRHIVYHKPQFFVLVDEVGSEIGARVTSRIHPGVAYQTKNGALFLHGSDGMFAMLVLGSDQPQMIEDRHPLLASQRGAPFSWIPFVDLTLKAQREKTYLSYVFLPVENEAEAEITLRASSVQIEDQSLTTRVFYRDRWYSHQFQLAETPAR